MFSLTLILFSLLLTFTTTTLAACGISTDIGNGKAFYYSPSDTLDFSFYYQGSGCTDTSAPVYIQQPDGSTVTCGTITLDGVVRLQDCTGLTRGTMQEGSYTITHPISIGTFYETFTITHTQVTVLAPTPIDTVTTTPSRFCFPLHTSHYVILTSCLQLASLPILPPPPTL
jgi:hypothetical protein